MISKRFMEEVKKEFPVEKAYLFGSFAKKRANKDSDIDVCIVSPMFGKNYLEEEMRLISLAMKIDDRLSPVVFNSEDIKDHWSQLAYEITKYGIQI